ncbi:hypothetical protein TYRP_017247 [Tyrophagus putrescentiae]|nr:hypothetical protein TYRP_017247 [Tyrophagus putrescentiae]
MWALPQIDHSYDLVENGIAADVTVANDHSVAVLVQAVRAHLSHVSIEGLLLLLAVALLVSLLTIVVRGLVFVLVLPVIIILSVIHRAQVTRADRQIVELHLRLVTTTAVFVAILTAVLTAFSLSAAAIADV